MKKVQAVSAGIAFVLAIVFTSHAQTAIRAVQSVPADNMAVMMRAVGETTSLPAESVPENGIFIGARLPDGPPLPGPMGWPAWNLGQDGFGQNVWLLDDLDQPQAQMQTMARSMMAVNVPSFGDGGS